MRPYEVMVIFDVDLEEGDIRQRIDRVHELVRAKGGTPGSVSHWGRRTFAYEIKHRSEGYYVVLEATAEPPAMADVDRYLALEDAVLRHKVIRQPDHVAGRAGRHGHRRETAREASVGAPPPLVAESAGGDSSPADNGAAMADEPIAENPAENSGVAAADDAAGSPQAGLSDMTTQEN